MPEEIKLPSPNEVFGSEKKLPKPSEVLPSPEDILGSDKKKVPTESTSVSEGGPSISESKGDNLYTYSGRPEALYKKEQGRWFVDPKRTGDFIEIKDPNRLKVLSKNAKQAYIADDEFEFASVPKQETIKSGGLSQKAFSESFSVLDENDPIVVARKNQEKKMNNVFNQINQSLIGRREEDVVPMLKGILSESDEDIFDFEETGIGYDALKVTNKLTGKSIDINLDNWSSDRDSEEAKLLKSFLDVGVKFKDQAIKQKKLNELEDKLPSLTPIEALKTQSEIDNLRNDIKNIQRLKENYANDYNDKYVASVVYDENQVDNIKNEIAGLFAKSLKIKEDKAELEKWIKPVYEALNDGRISEQEFNSNYLPQYENAQKNISDQANRIINDLNVVRHSNESLNKLAGLYMASQEERGNIISGTVKSFIKGVESPLMFVTRTAFRDPAKVQQDLLDITSPGIASPEYFTSENRNDFEKAIFGISESIGAALTGGGGLGSTSSIFALTYNQMKNEFESSPELANIPEYKKILLSAAVSAPVALLERFGLDSIMRKTPAGKAATNWILKNVFSELPKNASKEMLELSIKKNIKAAISQGLLNTTEAGLIEGTTEAIQTGVEFGTKEMFNKLEDGDFFNTPKTAESWIGLMGESFKLGLIGGGLVKSISESVNVPLDMKTQIDLEKISNVIQDKNLKDIFETSLRAKVATGEITKDQAKAELKNIAETGSIINKIPEDINPEDKYLAYKLIVERDQIEKSIAGKDEALVASQKERINAINEELKAISINQTTQEDAVQEQTTDESMLHTEESEMGLREVVEGDTEKEVTAEESEKEISVKLSDLYKKLDSLASRFMEEGLTEDQANKKSIEAISDDERLLLSESYRNETSLDDVSKLDTTDQTNLQKVQSYLDGVLNDLDSFGKETLGMNLPVVVARTVVKTIKTLVDAGVTLEQAIKQASQQHNVTEQDITDTLYTMTEARKRKMMERLTGEKIEKPVVSDAAKAAKEISKSSQDKITISEKEALKSQLKMEARASKEGYRAAKEELEPIIKQMKQDKRDEKSIRKTLDEKIKDMTKRGVIDARKASSMTRKISKLNTKNPDKIQDFILYASKVFENADYSEKLDRSLKYSKRFKKYIKTSPARTVNAVKEFMKLKPNLIEDIDEYLDIAEKIDNAISTSFVRSKDGAISARLREAVDLDMLTEYVSKQKDIQDKIMSDRLLDQHKMLVDFGVIDGDMSLSDIRMIVNELSKEDNSVKEEDEQNVRRYIKQRFDDLKGVIDLSGINSKDRDIMNELLLVDVDQMPVKEALAVIDAMNNFLINETTDGVESLVRTYKGVQKVKGLVSSGLKSKDLKLFFSEKFGRAFSAAEANLYLLIDNAFKGESKGRQFLNESGLDSLFGSVSKANKKYTNKITEHKNEFQKTKPNNEAFNTANNIYERGIYAYLIRTLDGSDLAKSKLFVDRVSNVKNSIDNLKKIDAKKAEAIEKSAKKLGIFEADVTPEKLNIDPINKKDVEWWIDTWSEIYDDLHDVSLSVYNTELSRDSYYTTDKIGNTRDTGLLEDSGTFAGQLVYTHDKKTGVLKENNRFKIKTGGDSFVDFDFDSNQANAYKAALIDLNTASDIRQLKGFLEGKDINGNKYFNDLFSNRKDADMVRKRITDFVKAFKGKMINQDISDAGKTILNIANKYSKIATSLALGSGKQWVLQTIPVGVNTLINAGRLDINLVFNKDAMNFLANSGESIALRGLESISAIERSEKHLERGSGKVGDTFERMNDFWLKYTIKNADLMIANASWLSYYIQDLKRQGENTKNIDWSTHQKNEQAAKYAEHKMARQQNISLPELAGGRQMNPNVVLKLVSKVLMPFSNFSLNQKVRMQSDIRTLSSKTSTVEDKLEASRSLSALMTEMIVYNGVKAYVGYIIYSAIMQSLDIDESDEDKQKRLDFNIKNGVKNFIQDVVSPHPLANYPTILASNYALAKYQSWMNEDSINEAVDNENKKRLSEGLNEMTDSEKNEFKKKYLEDITWQMVQDPETKLGSFDIPIKQTDMLVDLIKKSGGEFEKETITGGKSTRYLTDDDKKLAETGALIQAMYVLRILPAEAGQAANIINRELDKRSLTVKEESKMEEMSKDMELDMSKKYVREIVKSGRNLENSIYEIQTIEQMGGLTDDQYDQYEILRKEYGEGALGFLNEIKKGVKAEKLMQ